MRCSRRSRNATQNDARASEAAAQILSKAGQFDQAETFLTHALAAEPSNFQLMYALGVTASQAGHNDRAKTVLEGYALRQKPQDVNTLYTWLAFWWRMRLAAAGGRDPLCWP